MFSLKRMVGITALVAAFLFTSGTAASAATTGNGSWKPNPEISVTAVTAGVSDGRYFEIRNEGNTSIPAGTTFRFQSNGVVGIGLFADNEIGGYQVHLLGSRNEATIRLTTDTVPGEVKRINLARVEVSAFTKYSLQLEAGPNFWNIDRNPNNNKASISCLLNAAVLSFCTADNSGQ